MNPDFNHIPNDPDTTIIFEQQGVFDDIPACYQSWLFEGISGESIVFLCKDLKDKKDTELLKKIKASQLVQNKNQITFSRKNPDYLFINFNFSVRN